MLDCLNSIIVILFFCVGFFYYALVIRLTSMFIMKNIINYLRTHRKNTSITQYDIAVLLELKSNSLVSRCEKGFRTPSLEMILVYHLFLNIPIETLFSNHVSTVREQLLSRIKILIAEIESSSIASNAQSRIHFLQEAFTRLSQNQPHEA
jgi:transcriptional regulator with XRE-family HTH domain